LHQQPFLSLEGENYLIVITQTLSYRQSHISNDRIRRRAQRIDATHALNLSAGVSYFNVLRGRSFN